METVNRNARHNQAKLRTQAGSSRAFTLLELLMVVAVVTLIIVALMPVLGRARRDANRSTCFNNMHQSALAVSMYIEDYDNVYPSYKVASRFADPDEAPLGWHDRFCRALGAQPNQISWVSLSRPYAESRSRALQSSTLRSQDVYHCPADNDRGAALTSYEFKMLLATGLPLAQVHSLTSTALLWEQWAFHSDTSFSEYDRRAEMNMVFVDNHAAWIRLSNTTNARYGPGPDLHWLPSAASVPLQYRDEDVAF